LPGADSSLAFSVPLIAAASGEVLTSTYMVLTVGKFSNKNDLFCMMQSFSSKDDSSFKAASFPSVRAILSWNETNFIARPAAFLSKLSLMAAT
jgi:hypothetical protein